MNDVKAVVERMKQSPEYTQMLTDLAGFKHGELDEIVSDAEGTLPPGWASRKVKLEDKRKYVETLMENTLWGNAQAEAAEIEEQSGRAAERKLGQPKGRRAVSVPPAMTASYGTPTSAVDVDALPAAPMTRQQRRQLERLRRKADFYGRERTF